MQRSGAVRVVSFYRFVDIADSAALQSALRDRCAARALLGTILLADEGFNGTLAGDGDALRAVFAWLEKRLALERPIDGRWTQAAAAPFKRLKVRVKAEIVSLGRPDIRPQRATAQHVRPEDWNALLDRPDTLLIDTRNHYEIELGRFPGALDPGSDSFREFAEFAGSLAAEDRERPLAMYCTGGIRCEKASALLLEQGFRNVYQLQGGILNYLQRLAQTDQRWQGECFVFDSRVAVDRDLAEGGYEQCHACRRPLSSDDIASPHYRNGVSCPYCAKPTRRRGRE